MDYRSAEDRYLSDPMFHALVDAIYSHIASLKITPTEVREAAMLACIRFEQRNPRPLIFSHFQREVAEMLRKDLGDSDASK